MIHVAGIEREEDWVGIQCVAWSPGHYDDHARWFFFFFASLQFFVIGSRKQITEIKGEGMMGRLESRGCERLLCDVYWEKLTASSKKSIH